MQALNSLDDLFYVVEAGTLQRWNNQVPELTGYPPSRLQDRDILELVPEDEHETNTNAVELALLDLEKLQVNGDFSPNKQGAKTITERILIVDDDESIRQILEHNLERDGYTVQICENGQEAAELFEEGYEPQLAIFDVMMPQIDGIRLLRKVRNGRFPVSTELPILMLTSRGREEHVLEGFESGADDYVTKPFKPAELLARVERYIDD